MQKILIYNSHKHKKAPSKDGAIIVYIALIKEIKLSLSCEQRR